jgi:hypothetical protein
MDLDSFDLPAVTLNPLAPDPPISIPVRNQTAAAALMMAMSVKIVMMLPLIALMV